MGTSIARLDMLMRLEIKANKTGAKNRGSMPFRLLVIGAVVAVFDGLLHGGEFFVS